MSSKSLALISIVVNLILAVGKFLVGVVISSMAMIAEGIHSGLDVFSSLIAFLGIREAGKEESKLYPYGRYRFESLAALVVTILLASSAGWILWEAFTGLGDWQKTTFSIWGVSVMVISIILNEIMARWKFKVGGEGASLALVADAEHDRADVIASVGVLVGLFLMPYFIWADSVIALLVGLYIIYEAISLGRQAIDSLVDIANPELEEKIKEIAQEIGVEIEELKSRKIGAANFAELKIDLPANFKLDQATGISEKLEQKLLSSLPELKQVLVLAKSHSISRSLIRPSFGFGQIRGRGPGGGIRPIDYPKKGQIRVIIPQADGQSSKFGAPYYLVQDLDRDGRIVQEKKIKNPFWSIRGGHGVKFAKAISADKVIAKDLGDNAKANLKAARIEYQIKR
jgi:cation diffusion facilitator family transporter